MNNTVIFKETDDSDLERLQREKRDGALFTHKYRFCVLGCVSLFHAPFLHR
jgi:hypothetical protein